MNGNKKLKVTILKFPQSWNLNNYPAVGGNNTNYEEKNNIFQRLNARCKKIQKARDARSIKLKLTPILPKIAGLDFSANIFTVRRFKPKVINVEKPNKKAIDERRANVNKFIKDENINNKGVIMGCCSVSSENNVASPSKIDIKNINREVKEEKNISEAKKEFSINCSNVKENVDVKIKRVDSNVSNDEIKSLKPIEIEKIEEEDKVKLEGISLRKDEVEKEVFVEGKEVEEDIERQKIEIIASEVKEYINRDENKQSEDKNENIKEEIKVIAENSVKDKTKVGEVLPKEVSNNKKEDEESRKEQKEEKTEVKEERIEIIASEKKEEKQEEVISKDENIDEEIKLAGENNEFGRIEKINTEIMKTYIDATLEKTDEMIKNIYSMDKENDIPYYGLGKEDYVQKESYYSSFNFLSNLFKRIKVAKKESPNNSLIEKFIEIMKSTLEEKKHANENSLSKDDKEEIEQFCLLYNKLVKKFEKNLENENYSSLSNLISIAIELAAILNKQVSIKEKNNSKDFFIFLKSLEFFCKINSFLKGKMEVFANAKKQEEIDYLKNKILKLRGRWQKVKKESFSEKESRKGEKYNLFKYELLLNKLINVLMLRYYVPEKMKKHIVADCNTTNGIRYFNLKQNKADSLSLKTLVDNSRELRFSILGELKLLKKHWEKIDLVRCDNKVLSWSDAHGTIEHLFSLLSLFIELGNIKYNNEGYIYYDANFTKEGIEKLKNFPKIVACGDYKDGDKCGIPYLLTLEKLFDNLEKNEDISKEEKEIIRSKLVFLVGNHDMAIYNGWRDGANKSLYAPMFSNHSLSMLEKGYVNFFCYDEEKDTLFLHSPAINSASIGLISYYNNNANKFDDEFKKKHELLLKKIGKNGENAKAIENDPKLKTLFFNSFLNGAAKIYFREGIKNKMKFDMKVSDYEKNIKREDKNDELGDKFMWGYTFEEGGFCKLCKNYVFGHKETDEFLKQELIDGKNISICHNAHYGGLSSCLKYNEDNQIIELKTIKLTPEEYSNCNLIDSQLKKYSEKMAAAKEELDDFIRKKQKEKYMPKEISL